MFRVASSVLVFALVACETPPCLELACRASIPADRADAAAPVDANSSTRVDDSSATVEPDAIVIGEPDGGAPSGLMPPEPHVPCSVRLIDHGLDAPTFVDTCASSTICACPDGSVTCDDTGTCIAPSAAVLAIELVAVRAPDDFVIGPPFDCFDVASAESCLPPDLRVRIAQEGSRTHVAYFPDVPMTLPRAYAFEWRSPRPIVDVALDDFIDIVVQDIDSDSLGRETAIEAFACPGGRRLDRATIRGRQLGCSVVRTLGTALIDARIHVRPPPPRF